MKVKLLIIGSGPAAWTAAIYAARAELKPVVFVGQKAGGIRGGQLMLTTEVENYPGFSLGVMGPELVRVMEDQARRFGTVVYEEDVVDVDLSTYPFIVRGGSNTLQAESVIVATGAYAKTLDVPGSKQFWQKGVSACAVCDGALPIFRNQDLAVVGGGDTACEEAVYLTKYAKRVYMVLRRDKFRASKIMEERVLAHPKIEIIYDHHIDEVFGTNKIAGIHIRHATTGKKRQLDIGGLFYAIGHTPNTDFLKGQMNKDCDDYLVVTPGSTHTSVPGVFAAGDVADKKYRQAVTAAGTGCMAALDALNWLEKQEQSNHSKN
jgi:thioredoxin reductase (NADPH)